VIDSGVHDACIGRGHPASELGVGGGERGVDVCASGDGDAGLEVCTFRVPASGGIVAF
jgi:hypothetical protein